MKIGVSANASEYSCFGKRWGEKTYEKLSSFGFTHIDFSCMGDFSSPFMTLPEEEAKALVLYEKELAERSGLVLHQAHAPVIAQEKPYTEEQRTKLMEGIKRAVRLCGVADIHFLVVHPLMVNGWSDRGSEIAKDTFEQNVKLLTELGDYAKDFDVTICYENMPCIGFSISHPHEVAEVVRTVNHPNVAVCLDTGHTMAFRCGKDIDEQIKEVGDLIKVLHVHDTYGNADQHNLPGIGCTDWTAVRDALHEIGYEGVFSLELNRIHDFSIELFDEIYRITYKMADEIINK